MQTHTEKKINKRVKDKLKKEDELDEYIAKKDEKKLRYQESEAEIDLDDDEEDKTETQLEFFKNKIKVSKIIPPKIEKKENLPNTLGNFETEFGTLSVGKKKHNKKAGLGFSIIPEEIKKKLKIPSRKLLGRTTYFGGEKQEKKKFKASEISFKYNPQTKKIERLERYDADGIADSQDGPLYQERKENIKIEVLNSVKNEKDTNAQESKDISKEKTKLRDVRKQKREDNLKFIKEIENFRKNLSNGKAKKIIPAEEVSERKKRIEKMSGEKNFDLLLLKKLLEEQKENKKFKKYLKLDLKNLTKKEIKEITEKLKEGT